MKKAIATLICCCFLVQCLIQLGVVGYYELNKAYIAKNFCTHQGQPTLNCAGKCYLNKQLKKVDPCDQEHKDCPRKATRPDALFALLPAAIIPSNAALAGLLGPSVNPGNQDLYGYSPLHCLLRPPITC